ncbi:MAG: PEGA domain-containing protein, partial [Calditrichota bacterium]
QTLEDIIMKALNKDAGLRYQTAEEMLEALERFEQDSDGHAPAGNKTFNNSPTITLIREITQNPVNLKWVAIPIIALITLIAGYFIATNLKDILFPVKQYAALEIQSQPSGAVVYFDNIPMGRTPFYSDSVEIDLIDIRVEKSGYGFWEKKDVLFEPGETLEFKPTLVEGSSIVYGNLQINSTPPGAAIWLNDQHVGNTPFNGDSLKAQDYLVRLVMNGYEEFRETVTLSEGATQNMSASLVRLPRTSGTTRNGGTGATSNPVEDPFLAKPPSNIGQLELRVEPSGSIFVNGGHKARSDDDAATASVAVDKGEHKVRFVHPDYGSREYTLDVQRGEKKSLTCYFETFLNIQSLDETGSHYFGYLVINGQTTRETTPISNYPLGPGTYRISVRRLGHRTLEEDQIITVRPQTSKPKPRKLVFTLRKE